MSSVRNQLVEVPRSWRFTWRIENFSKLKTKKHYSDIFLVDSRKWRVLIYPNGNRTNHLSVYLDVVDSADLPNEWTRFAQFSFALVCQTNDCKSKYRADSSHLFNRLASHWGFTRFIPLHELKDPKNGYIVNDTCIVEVEIVVSRVTDSFVDNLKMKEGDVGKGAPIAEMDPVMELLTELENPIDDKRIETVQLLEYPEAGKLYREGKYRRCIHDEKFVDIGGFSVLKTQALLYKKIWSRYGHIASSQVLTASMYTAQVMMVTDILYSVMDIHQCRLSEVSSVMIDWWENKIQTAEKLGSNILWLRERFEDIKKDFYCEQMLKTTLLVHDHALWVAKEELKNVQKNLSAKTIQSAKDDLKKVQENLSSIDTRISPLLLKRQEYVDKGSRSLLDGLL